MSDRPPGIAVWRSSHRRLGIRRTALALLVAGAICGPARGTGAQLDGPGASLADRAGQGGGLPGDCNRDGCVTIAEILRMLRCILSIIVEPPECERCGVRTINEIIAALNIALTGCQPTATATRAGPSATPTRTPTRTATCAPTGTPYCRDRCFPCPTIRAGCYRQACGRCFENPRCGVGERCPKGADGCCRCATPTASSSRSATPTATPTPLPPGDLGWKDIDGIVFDAAAGEAAAIAGAAVAYAHSSFFSGPGRNLRGEVPTDAAGHFSFRLFLRDTDRLAVRVSAAGFTEQTQRFDGLEFFYDLDPQQQVNPIRFALQRAGS